MDRTEDDHQETAIPCFKLKRLYVNRYSIVIALSETISLQTTFYLSQPQPSKTLHIYCV